ncbi:MAG: protein kinase [Pirellulales bacterium]
MRDDPSKELIELLDRLGLATVEDVRRARRNALQLARELPLFDSVWVDALVQARVLTPFQAERINAGRGTELQVGPYVLSGVQRRLGYASWFDARHIETHHQVLVAIAEPGQLPADDAARRLRAVVELGARVTSDAFVPAIDAGVAASRAWMACTSTSGTWADAWMVRRGRFTPQAVLEIARQMARALAELESIGGVHGDICLACLILDPQGRVRLPLPGLRGAVRPHEGYSHAELPPDAYGYLAPERVIEGSPVSRASDLYACGCTWWHLLTGRPPLPGGNALARLKSVQKAKVLDVRQLAPETPGVLVAAVQSCLQRDPECRPTSFAELASILAPPSRSGRTALAGVLAKPKQVRTGLSNLVREARRSRHAPVWSAAALGACLMLAGVTWSYWRTSLLDPVNRWLAASAADEGAEQSDGARTEVTAVASETPTEDEPVESAGVVAAPQSSTEAVLATSEAPITADRSLLTLEGHVDARTIQLQPGQTVRSRPGSRARLKVTGAGLVVAVEDVVFEQIDFVYDAASNVSANAAALIDVRARSVEFRNCTFQAVGPSVSAVSAVVWSSQTDTGSLDQLPEAGVVRMVDSVLYHVAAGVLCQANGPRTLELDNTLHLGHGPLVRLDRFPGLEEPLSVTLSSCTLRAGDALLEIDCRAGENDPGRLSIDAVDCVFAPRDRGLLLNFLGERPSMEELRAIQWTGQGSLLAPATSFAGWRDDRGSSTPLDSASIRVDGLVLSQLDFAEAKSAQPAASQVVRWTAPIRSDKPPGIDPAQLSAPAAIGDGPAGTTTAR